MQGLPCFEQFKKSAFICSAVFVSFLSLFKLFGRHYIILISNLKVDKINCYPAFGGAKNAATFSRNQYFTAYFAKNRPRGLDAVRRNAADLKSRLFYRLYK